jgi:hypothetical protein
MTLEIGSVLLIRILHSFVYAISNRFFLASTGFYVNACLCVRAHLVDTHFLFYRWRGGCFWGAQNAKGAPSEHSFDPLYFGRERASALDLRSAQQGLYCRE